MISHRLKPEPRAGRVVGTFEVMRLWYRLLPPTILLVAIGAFAAGRWGASVGFGAMVVAFFSPVWFVGRWHPIKESRWCFRAYRNGFIPYGATPRSVSRTWLKAYDQCGGPPPPLACFYGTSDPYVFATDPAAAASS